MQFSPNCGSSAFEESVNSSTSMHFGLFPKGTTRHGGSRGGSHGPRGWGKSMLPVGSYSIWEGGLHGDSPGIILGSGFVGWVW